MPNEKKEGEPYIVAYECGYPYGKSWDWKVAKSGKEAYEDFKKSHTSEFHSVCHILHVAKVVDPRKE